MQRSNKPKALPSFVTAAAAKRAIAFPSHQQQQSSVVSSSSPYQQNEELQQDQPLQHQPRQPPQQPTPYNPMGNNDKDPFSTPARRRRIIAEFAKVALRSYYITACDHVVVYRIRHAAARTIQLAYFCYRACIKISLLRAARRLRMTILLQVRGRMLIAKQELHRRRRERLRRIKLRLALNIQRLWRIYSARKILRDLRNARDRKRHEARVAAAIHMERVTRGFIARRQCRRLRDAQSKRNAILRAAAIRIQTRQRILLAKKEVVRRKRLRWAWRLVIQACVHWRWEVRRRKEHRAAVNIQRVLRGHLARQRVRRMREDARLSFLAAEAHSVGGGYSVGMADDEDGGDVDAVEVISMVDIRLLQQLVTLGPAETVKWFLRRSVLTYLSSYGYSMGSFLLQVMRYTSDSFARSCEQQQQQESVGAENDDEERRTTSLEAIDEDQTTPPGLSIQVEEDENRLNERGDPGRGRDEKGRVVVVEKWDAFTALNKEGLNKQGHANGDGVVNPDYENEEDVPADDVLPTEWRETVSGRREIHRESVVESTSKPVVSSSHHVLEHHGVDHRYKSHVPMSDDLDEEIGESVTSPRDDAGTHVVGTEADTAATTTEEGEMVATALLNDWEDVGARVSVYYLEQMVAGEGGLFASTEESFRLDESLSMDPTAAASSVPVVSVRTVVLQIELLQEEQGKTEQEENNSHLNDNTAAVAASADGIVTSVAAVADDVNATNTDDADAATVGDGQRRSEEAAQATADQLPPPPPPKKSKILFIMHAKSPPDGDASSLASIEISARSLFRDMLIRMLAAGVSNRHANHNHGFHSPPMSLLSPLAVTAAYPHMDFLNTSLLSQQSVQSVESLDSLVAGADGWGTHPRHLYSLRMTLVDDQVEEEEEPPVAKRSQPSYFSPTRRSKRDLSQSMVVTPLGLSSRAKGQSHTITQPHSQLRLMLVSPPKSPKKTPNWGLFARRIQRLARRFLTLRHHSASLIQRMTRRRRLLYRWQTAVMDIWNRAITAVVRIQMLARRFVAQCRVHTRRDDRCTELECHIEQLVLNDIQADRRRWDHPDFSFHAAMQGDEADQGRTSDIWMLCADDIPLYDVMDPSDVNNINNTKERSVSSNSLNHDDDDDDEELRPITISLRDFRAHKNNDKVAATTWAATLLHSLEPSSSMTADNVEGTGTLQQGPGGGQIPPGCLLPFTI